MITLKCNEGDLDVAEDEQGALMLLIDGKRRTLSPIQVHTLAGQLTGCRLRLLADEPKEGTLLAGTRKRAKAVALAAVRAEPRAATGHSTTFHIELTTDRFACSTTHIGSASVPAERVPHNLRCGRVGCKTRWPNIVVSPLSSL